MCFSRHIRSTKLSAKTDSLLASLKDAQADIQESFKRLVAPAYTAACVA
jgi:hypothetical protein